MGKSLLIGIHDVQGHVIASSGSWLLDTVALSDDYRPQPLPFAADLNLITRLNWGYGATGTLPPEERYPDFAERASAYARASRVCRRWIVGNEPNHSQEWPNNEPIMPEQYGECYRLTRNAIRSLPDHEQDEVLIAASAPWNNQTVYVGNPNGDWIRYFSDQIRACHGEVDGFAIHAYTHGYDPALVSSEARMNSPFSNYHYNFRVYRDYCWAIPAALAHLPIYITEANGNGPWQATGLMPAMLQEIADWNLQNEKTRIYSCIFYRYPAYDAYAIEGKPAVIAEYQQAALLDLDAPESYTLHLPSITQPLPITEPAIDPRATARGVTVTVADGSPAWRVTKVQWYDEQQADNLGPDHHILVDVLDEQGQRLPGQAVQVRWPDGNTFIFTQAKPGEPYAADFPMSPSRNEFSVQVADDILSDKVLGIGMGADTPEGFNPGIHTSTGVIFQRRSAVADMPVWVIAPAGVNLRNKPLDGVALTALPYGQRLQASNVPMILGWRYVSAGALSGWVLDRYLSKVAPPVQPVVTAPVPLPDSDPWTRSRAFVRRWEGGYQNVYTDRGNWTSGTVGVGELKGTKYGISAASYPQLDIVNLTMEQADAIYERDYWVASGANRLAWPVCLLVFDTAVLHGVGTAKGWLERYGANAYAFTAQRLQVYLNSDGWDKWGKAWVKRTAELLMEVVKTA